MLDQSVDYIFNDPYENYIHILDDTLLYSTIDFSETLNHLEFKEKTTPKDYVEFSYYTD